MNDFRSPQMAAALGRYREIVRDWAAFEAAHRTPEPVGIRIRRGRGHGGTGPGGVEAGKLVVDRLRREGFDIVEAGAGLAGGSSGAPGLSGGRAPGANPLAGLYQVRSGPRSVSRTLEHWLGLFHIQQTVMALPPLALAPRPGERVLDLCAAPGGKTTHLAELMDDRGPLVAVDRKEKRLRGLLSNVYRLGHPNILVAAADGRTLPGTALFDRVLVDAPCSAEGTTRRQNKAPKRREGFAGHVTRVQEELLRSAIRLTRPGGTIVYSTCTYAPEENEAVVDRLVAEGSVRLEVIPMDLPHEPGLLEWAGTPFSPEMAQAWRVYPHHLDSGGLFMALLRRTGEGEPAGGDGEGEGGQVEPGRTATRGGEARGGPTGWTPIPDTFPGEDAAAGGLRVREAIRALEEEMGLPPERLRSLGWMTRGENVWAHTAGEWPFPAWEGAPAWRVVSAGIRALKKGPTGREVPSNHFLARWGDALPAERRVELDREALLRLLDGPIPRPPRGAEPDPSKVDPSKADPPKPDPSAGPDDAPVTGPVALAWEGVILGRAIAGRDGTLRHEIPKALAAELREVLGG